MTDAILPHALPAALDRDPGARVFSLDCFNTLLWRDIHMPAAEVHHCFAFAASVECMRQAKASSPHMVIVSGTYFDPKQLREVIARAAREEVASPVACIFCSSTCGKTRSAVLYGEVLPKPSAKPHDFLHIGGNRKAAISGMFHLQPEADATARLPHRAALAMAEPRNNGKRRAARAGLHGRWRRDVAHDVAQPVAAAPALRCRAA